MGLAKRYNYIKLRTSDARKSVCESEFCSLILMSIFFSQSIAWGIIIDTIHFYPFWYRKLYTLINKGQLHNSNSVNIHYKDLYNGRDKTNELKQGSDSQYFMRFTFNYTWISNISDPNMLSSVKVNDSRVYAIKGITHIKPVNTGQQYLSSTSGHLRYGTH